MNSESSITADQSVPRRGLPIMPLIELAVLAFAIVAAVGTYILLSEQDSPKLLTPPLVALLLIANMLPWMALLVLFGRRVAMRRAAESAIGGNGRLHVRLVAIFSLIAAVPMVLVTIFASLLFQYGVQFFFSDHAQGMLENASALAQENYSWEVSRVNRETLTMTKDLNYYLESYSYDSKEFVTGFGYQIYRRELNQGRIVRAVPGKEIQTLAIANPDESEDENPVTPAMIAQLRAGKQSVIITRPDSVNVVTTLNKDDNTYLYTRRIFEKELASQIRRGRTIVHDYQTLRTQARKLQIRFNAALFAASLLIVGLAVFVALQVADRLVRPVSDLVDAARRVAGGDMDARVPAPQSVDEIGTLANAFNRMTGRLQEQTNALVAANAQAESRRALIEAVMSGVRAGVISIGEDRNVRLINRSAMELLRTGEEPPVGMKLHSIAPELDALLDDDAGEAIVQMTVGGEAKTLAVKITHDESNRILTFDDITQQLLDQRRAAWSDVARRIAHEIKNPLTPIQLAAERLQRRYGGKIDADDTTFGRLTETIVRQVGDLRRMVDEFSSFARMPKPVFRDELIGDIVRQTVFLHEVAHPDIRFTVEQQEPPLHLICDRRQLGQAMTNVVKNAVEAVGTRPDTSIAGAIEVKITSDAQNGKVCVAVIDNGIGLPVERDRIVEPYMTTRARGTGLGLAIVKKIVEEHFGTIEFSDRPEGGTIVRLVFDAHLLAGLAESRRDDRSEPQTAHPSLTRSKSVDQ
ncbi:two-component system sensor histidine kinase NtrY [Stakelama sediminis]|uniref:histidine kinase n=1 Tax=Stakelama sediminis TaxID=463200 RepID=A0A840YZ68_9SPHN|nr:ATP-binding protein [Stakelama sediminis]MBB5718806.1 two-component system nitrogen regulation sensor histidine kinase NtrY [Stakelama sediminis]